MAEAYDYIIVGAGSAGCVLANRLSADPSVRVLLIEAGGRDTSPLIKMPKGIGKLVIDPTHAWHFPVAQPREEGLESRELWVSGKVLGGSSSINGMIYTRGQPEDYDAWEARGARGWNWAEMKRAFQAIEDHELGGDDLRGAGGPLHVSTNKYRYPLTERMIEAGERLGLPRRDDLNREDQEGVGYYAHTIKNGRRFSSAEAFLRPAENRVNLDVRTGVLVDRIVFKDRRATGVIGRANGAPVAFNANREVIVSCGAVLSPKLLQLSGVGSGARLRTAGVDVVVDSPYVGEGLRDHLGFSLAYRLKQDRGINHEFRGFGLVKNVLRYALAKTGPLSGGPFEVGGFAKTDPNLKQPDLQLYLGALTMVRGDDNFPAPTAEVERLPGITIAGSMIQLTSTGALHITSSDPDAPLNIEPNWLSTPADQRTAVASMRYLRSYMAQAPLEPFLDEELPPSAKCQTDEEMAQYVRRAASSSLHAVGTCAMGGDNKAVTDERLRVRGVDGLRVVDCSAMPGLISGNTNAPAMALAWRAADLIAADARV